MNDPTRLVIEGSFLTALLIGGAGLCMRWWRAAHREGPPDLLKGKVPTWFFRPLDLVAAALIFVTFCSISMLSLHASGAPLAKFSPSSLLFNIIAMFTIAGVVAIFPLRHTTLATWLGLRWKRWYWVFLIGPGCVVFIWIIFAGLNAVGYNDWMKSLGVQTVQDTILLFQKSKNPAVMGLLAFTAVVVAPICEETIFRGVLYPVMKKFAGVWPAAICSALVFAAAHGNTAVLLPLFILALVLVAVYEMTGSLWAPISVHFCFNAASVSVELLMRLSNHPTLHFGP